MELQTNSNIRLLSKPHYEILDGLRGVAAIVILIYHLCEGSGIIFGHGYLGVDFFYALSGFVIGYAYDDRWNRMTIKDFFKRRIIRLHPMVIMGTLLGLLLYYFGQQSQVFPFIGERPLWMVLSLFVYCCLMLPMPNGWDLRGWQDFNSFNGNIWSLYWEYVANILYVLVFRFLPTTLLCILTFIAALGILDLTLNIDMLNLFASGRVGAPFTVNGGWSLTPAELYVGAVRLCYPFLIGLLLSRIKTLPHIRHAFGGSALLIAILFFMPQFSGITNGLYEAIVILFVIPFVVVAGAGGQLKKERSVRWCRFLGNISYPLYITHLPLIYMQLAWNTNHPDSPTEVVAMMAVSLFFISIAVAYASYKLYDLPVRLWLRNRFLS